MSYFKDMVISEEESIFWKEQGNAAASARTEGGRNDAMGMMDELDAICGIKPIVRNEMTDVEEGNTFGAHEDAQERLAYENEMKEEAVLGINQVNPDDTIIVVSPAVNFVEVPPPVAYKHKGVRHQLVLEGVCTHCAHCGHLLKDAESVERGIGPVCSKKGYHEDPKSSADATDAMIALSEYPELVDWLNKKYVPGGVRKLVNGLVRTASLNRRTPVHAACTDAVEALGYKSLASLLRESIATVEITEPQDHAGFYEIWIKKSDFSWSWQTDLRKVPGYRWVHGTGRQVRNLVPKTVNNRAWLAQIVVKHFDGLFVKTAKGSTKITQEWFNCAQAKADRAAAAIDTH